MELERHITHDNTPVLLQVKVRSRETVDVVIPKNLCFIVTVPLAVFPLFEQE